MSDSKHERHCHLTEMIRTVYGPDASPTGFEVYSAEWNELLRRSRFNSFFLTHEWQTTWWKHLGQGELWIVAFHRGSCEASAGGESRELVGLIPLFRFKQRAQPVSGGEEWVFALVGCTEVSDYLDAIILQGFEEAVYRSFFSWLQSEEAPLWHLLDLCNLPEESLTYQLLPELLAQCALEVEVLQEDVAPQFELPPYYDTYLLEMVDKKQRHEIRRKQRRAEREAHCEFVVIGQDLRRKKTASAPNSSAQTSSARLATAELDREIEDFLQLQMSSRKDKADFMTEEMATFFREMARRMMEAGHLRLSFLKLDGIKAATLMAFEYDGRYWLYNSGYKPDVFASLSPGWVLLAYTIQYAVVVGLKVYDFMQGSEEYKYRFGSQDYKVMRVTVKRSTQDK